MQWAPRSPRNKGHQRIVRPLHAMLGKQLANPNTGPLLLIPEWSPGSDGKLPCRMIVERPNHHSDGVLHVYIYYIYYICVCICICIYTYHIYKYIYDIHLYTFSIFLRNCQYLFPSWCQRRTSTSAGVKSLEFSASGIRVLHLLAQNKKELHNINLVLIAATHITESIYTPNE